MRKGFTIVELLIVVAIIGILGGIVTNAAMGSIRGARTKRAEAMRVALEQSLYAYYAYMGEWPQAIEDKAQSMSEGTYTFSAGDTDKIFQEIVGMGYGMGGKGRKIVLIDASALFVAKATGLGNNGWGCYDNHANKKDRHTFCGGRDCKTGVDFTTAVAKSGKNHLRLKEMAFGYQGAEYGRFCRFWITYNAQTDSIKVSQRGPNL